MWALGHQNHPTPYSMLLGGAGLAEQTARLLRSWGISLRLLPSYSVALSGEALAGTLSTSGIPSKLPWE